MVGRRGRGPAPRILVVVESPAKCRTIQRYLGPQYVVKASFGHVRDLPAAGGSKRRGRKGGGGVALGVDTESWRGEWVVPKEKAAAVKVLRELAGRKQPVVLATDQDREGEAIAWHLREVLGGRADRFVRVTFNEITRSAVQRAFRSPGRVDMALVRAQLARRFLDRLVGWRVSPALVRATGDARSAGRVQSVALRLVVERERAIGAFRPEPYWEVVVGIEGGELAVWGSADGDDGRGAFRFGREEDAVRSVSDIRAAGEVLVCRVQSVPGVRKPHPPFVTATLQQAASARLKMGVKRTMELAQSLYERGLITYMRTDAVRLAPEAVEGIRGRVRELYGGGYLPEQVNSFKGGAGAQEAHEAIRPTGYAGAPEGLEADQAALYDLIERRALQSQMARARVRRDTVEGEAGGWRVGVSGVAVVFDGFERAWPPADRDAGDVPVLEAGMRCPVEGVRAVAKRTRAPKRFTEASLVAELEERGIGRPSTYAATIGVLVERGYVEVKRRDLVATELGERAVTWLLAHFPELLDPGFTAGLEAELDEVAGGRRDWKALLAGFRERLDRQVAGAA